MISINAPLGERIVPPVRERAEKSLFSRVMSPRLRVATLTVSEKDNESISELKFNEKLVSTGWTLSGIYLSTLTLIAVMLLIGTIGFPLVSLIRSSLNDK